MFRTIKYRLKGETHLHKENVPLNASPPAIQGLQPNREYELRECGSDSFQECKASDEGEIYFTFTLGGFRTYT